MASFFRSDSFIWKPFGWAADVLILSGLWFVCSAPLVTMGAATCALYDCVVRCVREDDKEEFGRFFRTFKRELIPSALSSLLWAGILWGLYLGIKAFGNSVAVTSGTIIFTTALLVILACIVGVFCWVLPLLSRFTFSLGTLNLTAVKLALVHLPRTMILGIVTILCAYFCLQFWIPFLFLPMLLMLFWSLLMEPVFREYMDNEE